jgi:hypothetical protein
VQPVVELSPFININAVDVKTDSGDKEGMKAKGLLGSSISAGLLIHSRSLFYIKPTIGLLLSPEKLEVRANELQQQETTTYSHTGIYCFLKSVFGVSIKTGKAGNPLEIGLSLGVYRPLNNIKPQPQLAYRPYTDPVTGEELNELYSVTNINWGITSSVDKSAQVIACAGLQAIYNIHLTGDKFLRIGGEVTSKIGSNDGDANNNIAESYHFGYENGERVMDGKYTFRDQHLRIALIVGITF